MLFRSGGQERRRNDDGRRRDRVPTPYVNVDCQICKKHGHSACDCWWRREDDNHGPREHRGANFASYGVDTNWYSDSGATDHITGDLNKLSTHDKYQGRDHVNTANGNSMHISHIGHSVLHTPNSSFNLNHVLHVPHASKNLISVHKLALDNNVFLEFHPFFFLIKDEATK